MIDKYSVHCTDTQNNNTFNAMNNTAMNLFKTTLTPRAV